jgi:hypothetical protein
MRHEHVPAQRIGDVADDVAKRRCALHHVPCDSRERGDHGRDGPLWVHEGLVDAGDLATLHDDCGNLRDSVAAVRPPTRRLHVDDDVGQVGELVVRHATASGSAGSSSRRAHFPTRARGSRRVPATASMEDRRRRRQRGANTRSRRARTHPTARAAPCHVHRHRPGRPRQLTDVGDQVHRVGRTGGQKVPRARHQHHLGGSQTNSRRHARQYRETSRFVWDLFGIATYSRFLSSRVTCE